MDKNKLIAARRHIERIDSAAEGSWPSLLQALLDAGFTRDDIEFAASLDLVERWLAGTIAPRKLTRRLLQNAAIDFLDTHLNRMPSDETQNCLPEYFELLHEALSKSEAEDAFDVHSEIPDSLAHFEELGRQSHAAQLALVDYVAANAEALRARFAKPDPARG